MKRVIIIYGEMGAGKTYEGKRLAEELNAPFFDGDDCILPDMLACVQEFEPISKAMLDDYIFYRLAPEIDYQMDVYGLSVLVVAQALYLREHRQYLMDFLQERGYCVDMREHRVPFWQNLKQLWSRKDGRKWVVYWLMNKPFFQR
jgi:hypothetical protein